MVEMEYCVAHGFDGEFLEACLVDVVDVVDSRVCTIRDEGLLWFSDSSRRSER